MTRSLIFAMAVAALTLSLVPAAQAWDRDDGMRSTYSTQRHYDGDRDRRHFRHYRWTRDRDDYRGYGMYYRQECDLRIGRRCVIR